MLAAAQLAEGKVDDDDDDDDDDEAKTTVIAAANVPELDDLWGYLEFVNDLEGVMKEAGFAGDLQLATFHPRYQFNGRDEDDVENFTNRSAVAALPPPA